MFIALSRCFLQYFPGHFVCFSKCLVLFPIEKIESLRKTGAAVE